MVFLSQVCHYITSATCAHTSQIDRVNKETHLDPSTTSPRSHTHEIAMQQASCTIMNGTQLFEASQVVKVDDEPLHQERWRSEIVRLVDVQFPPQTTSKWHQHVHYGVYICVTPIHATEVSAVDTVPKQLCKQRGEVFCRNHVEDHLVHVVSTSEDPMRIIEVELLRDTSEMHDHPPAFSDARAMVVDDNERCRVSKITLHPGTEPLTMELTTTAVVVALTACALKLRGGEDRLVSIPLGGDFQLSAGSHALDAVEGDCELILTEVY